VDAHCGFGAAAVVEQVVLERAMRTLHANEGFPTRMSATNVEILVQRARFAVDYDVYVDVPRITLTAANHPFAALSLRCIGSVAFRDLATGVVEAAEVVLDLHLRARVVAAFRRDDQGHTQLGAGLTFGAESMNAVEVAYLGRTPLSPGLDGFLRGTAGLVVLMLNGETAFNDITMLPAVLRSALDLLDTSRVTLATVRVRVLDGALAFGLDVTMPPGSDGSPGPELSGDASALTNFSTTGNTAAVLHPSLVALALKAASDAAIEEMNRRMRDHRVAHAAWVTAHAQWVSDVAAWETTHRMWVENGRVPPEPPRPPEPREPSEPPTLQRLDLSLQRGYIALSGAASSGGFSADFSAKARVLVHEGEVRVDIFDAVLHEPWWVVLLKVVGVTIPILNVVAGPTVFAVADTVRTNITRSAEGQIEGMLHFGASQQFILPGTTGPTCSLALRRVDLDTSGVVTCASFTVPRRNASVVLSLVHDDEWAAARAATCQAQITGALFHPRDTSVRITWEVGRRGEPGRLAQRTTAPGTEATTFRFPVTLDELHPSRGYWVSCRIFRALPSGAEELFASRMEVVYLDRLDYRHPYVVRSPCPPVPWWMRRGRGADETPTFVGYRVIERVPKIHHTHPAKRCRFAASMAKFTNLRYLDELPFPPGEVEQHRRRSRRPLPPDQPRIELCDYCFFGGPDKSVLLT
jgi:hypothetical protein